MIISPGKCQIFASDNNKIKSLKWESKLAYAIVFETDYTSIFKS